MMKLLLGLIVVLGLLACDSKDGSENRSLVNMELAKKILADKRLDMVYDRAKAIVKTGFNAGSGYSEVWIRDYNTFINLSCDILPLETVKNNLLMFFKFQGEDGNIVDGFVQEAYDELKPMIDRVLKNDGFYEWYTVEGKAMGSGEFRGSAGVLATAIGMLHAWAQDASK